MFLLCRCAGCRRPLRVLLKCHQGKTLRCPGCSATVFGPGVSGIRSIAARSETTAEPEALVEIPPTSAAMAAGVVLPWILLAPAALSLVLLMWVGQGVLWAAMGVFLGGFCLLLGQRVHWPAYVRVWSSLSLATLGHGLSLASLPGTALVLPPHRPERSIPLSPAHIEMIMESNFQAQFLGHDLVYQPGPECTTGRFAFGFLFLAVQRRGSSRHHNGRTALSSYFLILHFKPRRLIG